MEEAMSLITKKKAAAAVSQLDRRSVDLACGGSVRFEESSEGSVVRIASGGAEVIVRFTPGGPVVSLHGADLEITAARKLHLAAEELHVEVGQARMDVAGDLVERVSGDHHAYARGVSAVHAARLELEAVRGSARITASDDVDVKGERVRLNSDDPPMPMSVTEFLARRARPALASPAPDPSRE
jgi:hypothetical protein